MLLLLQEFFNNGVDFGNFCRQIFYESDCEHALMFERLGQHCRSLYLYFISSMMLPIFEMEN